MDSGSGSGVTKVWHCEHCGGRNVTTETDLFSDQCRNCTIYNTVDWSDVEGVSVQEASAVANRIEAE